MSREMKSGNVLSAMRYTSSSSFESGRASGRSFTMAGLHARGGDRPVDGTLQHLKGEGASTPPQRWITRQNEQSALCFVQTWGLKWCRCRRRWHYPGPQCRLPPIQDGAPSKVLFALEAECFRMMVALVQGKE
jgi:hypothetical protein